MNLPIGPMQLIGTSLFLISPFSKFALTLEPVAAGADAALQYPRGSVAGRVVRTSLGLFALLLASRVPFFGIFMSLLGSFLTLTVSVMFPAGAYLKIFWDELPQSEKNVNYAVIALGAVCTVTGTLTAFEATMHPAAVDSMVAAANDAVKHVSPSAQNSYFSKLVCHSLCELVPRSLGE